jgi:hypothetical protein
MKAFRRHLAACALVVVTCQMASLATGAILSRASHGESAIGNEVVCTCTHGPDAECPMHRSHKASVLPSSPLDHHCCSGRQDGFDALLTALLAPLAAPAACQELPAPGDTSASVPFAGAHIIDVTHSPISPPPRG